jgi:hypothetical protein
LAYQEQSASTSSCSFHDWYAAINTVPIPHRFQSSILVSQHHHIGRAFHYKAITRPPGESKKPSMFWQWMMKGERTKEPCEEIESLFLRIETASRWQAGILKMWIFAGAQ